VEGAKNLFSVVAQEQSMNAFPKITNGLYWNYNHWPCVY